MSQVPEPYQDEWELSRRLEFSYRFRLERVEGQWFTHLKEHVAEIGGDERFGYMHICVKLAKLENTTWLPATQTSIEVTKTEEYKDSATAVWVVHVYNQDDVGRVDCATDESPSHPAFKHAWVTVKSDLFNLKPGDAGEFEVWGWIDVWRQKEMPPPEEKPPEKPPEEKPPKPEKPEEPFDLGKWLEFALRKILRDVEPPACSPHNTWLLAMLLTVIYLNTLADIDWWVTILGLTPIPGIFLGEPWRLFTYMWLHYPLTEVLEGWTIPHAHIAFNVLFLWVFGDNVECRLGYGKYIAYYIVCGITAGLGQVMWLHIIGLGFEPIIIIGASGAISGILGMYLVFFPDNTVVFLGKEMRAYWFIIGWFLGQVAMLFSLELTVGVAAHIVGFLTGLVLASVEKRLEEEMAE